MRRHANPSFSSALRRVLIAGLLLLALRADAAALGVLENPAPSSAQSGVGLLSGWVCEAQSVVLEIDDTKVFQAAYGTSREDTRPFCDDANNGFGLLLNWNLLGAGSHRVRALADGVQIGAAEFVVNTLGTNFLVGASGRYPLAGFAGRDVLVEWQQSAQNFVLIQDPATRPDEIIAALEALDGQDRMGSANLPLFFRDAAEALNPEVVELIATGSEALPAILARFDGVAGYLDDVPLSLLAYALEQIGDPAAVPPLVEWLALNLFSELLWAPDFVTHAIKVLAGQDGLDTSAYTYGIEEMLDTISQARTGVAPSAGAASASAGSRAAVADEHAAPSAAPVPGGDSCVKTIVVTGIDDQGQERVVEIPYRVYSRDIHEQIDAATGATKTALESQRNRFLMRDQEFYGSSDYVPIEGAKVSIKSNCGGSVTERLIENVAQSLGRPIQLGEGTTGADDIRDLARLFGTKVSGFGIDTLTVIAHEYEGGRSAHVEIPISTTTTSAIVYSKDVQGLARTHAITRVDPFFDAVQNRYNFRPFSTYGQTTPEFYRIDPNRILGVVVDSGACPCDPSAPNAIPVLITAPTADETTQRVLQVSGTVGDPDVVTGTLRVNGSPQPISIEAGAFSTEVVLRSGSNTIKITVDAVDGRRGCVEKVIESTTPKTTLSATLTWNLPRSDVDLYVTQPDGQTAWYSAKTTSIGGRLDVDNTQGFGPENYFLSAADGHTILPGDYAIRVHYFADHDDDEQTPTRDVHWRVVVILNEGTDQEKRQIRQGSLFTASASNDAPGSTGGDWATAMTVNFSPEGSGTFLGASAAASAVRAAGNVDAPQAVVTGALEIPQPDSSQSGIGVLSGWVCNANRITLEIDGEITFDAPYGTTREDTRPVCGDANNGFGLLLNWNLLGDGGHRVRALADGMELAQARFVVKTLGVPFLRDAEGEYVLQDFDGRDVTVAWQESQQNFVIVGAQ